jgi:hypothetical protein
MDNKKPLNGWAFISKTLLFDGPTGYFEVGVPTELSQIPEHLQAMADRGVPVPIKIIERAIKERDEAKALSLRRLADGQSGEQSPQ